ATGSTTCTVAEGQGVAGIETLCDDNLALARQLVGTIEAQAASLPRPLTWDETFGQLDLAFFSVFNASEFPYLMGVTHPDEAIREAARDCEAKTEKLTTSLFFNRALADVLRAYAAQKDPLSPERQRFVAETLRDFRRNGIDLDADDKKRLSQLNEELTELGQRFVAEIGDSTSSIEVRPDQLKGLSESFISKHPAGANGKVTLTTDYTDFYDVAKFAEDREMAKRLYVKFVNRGGDVNVRRIERVLELRHEKAELLGYPSWAAYAVEPRMAKTVGAVEAFLDRVSTAIAPAVQRELAAFRKLFNAKGNRGKPMVPSDRYFLTEQLKNTRYKLDSKKLAQYFEIDRVTQGILGLTAEMYGLDFVVIEGRVWHPSVKTVEVREKDGKVVGTFYLDLQPREQKYKHAAMFGIREAKTLPNGSYQSPVAALVCNFPGPGEPMNHDQVVTYFHEFGHVLHHLFSKTELASFAGTNTARDFVETPSQMFEEWAWDRGVLDRFARHSATGAKIPAAMYEAMVASRRAGLALHTERQLYLARLDLNFHASEPGFSSTDRLAQVHRKSFSFQYVPGTHFQSSFGHLIGYDAGYYGYQWALTLAFDVLSRFQREGLLNRNTARAWREGVLSRGGSRDPSELVRGFLGREPTEEAYVDFLQRSPG
ncbi:MAG: M3 family metallopeptidase, partial [Myxococcota bacterium]